MLKTGLKKEMMFFTRSFRMWGILLAAVLFAVVSPLLMKVSFMMLDAIGDMDFSMEDTVPDSGDNGEAVNNMADFSMEITGDVDFGSLSDAEFASLGVISSLGDLTGTLMLVAMLVTMYSAGGELKKRSMIIPQNAGLTPQLYLLPKFLVYPLAMAVFGFCGIWISYGTCCLMFPNNDITIGAVAVTALVAGVFDAFMTAAYFTLGLCTAKAGLSVVIMYGGNTILTVLFSALGADKFHPFTLTTQAQEALLGEEVDKVNLWGSIGITLLIILLCYFVTLFVISAKRIDNRGKEEMEL
ncbi:MAG: hypothetical protein HDT44_07365 [Ruminococcaceae bacterium]|nr:hypothetical protein [Oscillospiraceae bacterium]